MSILLPDIFKKCVWLIVVTFVRSICKSDYYRWLFQFYSYADENLLFSLTLGIKSWVNRSYFFLGMFYFYELFLF